MTARQAGTQAAHGFWRGGLREIAFRRPRTTATVCFAIFAIVFVLLIAREAYQLHDFALDRRQRELEYRALVIQDNLTAGLQALSFMRATAEHFLDRRPTESEIAAESVVREARRVRDQRAWSIPVGGNGPPIQGVRAEVLAGLPGFKRREEELPADLLLGALMSRALGQTVLEHPFTARMVFVSSNGFFVSYPETVNDRTEDLLKIVASRPYFQGAAEPGSGRFVFPSTPIREEQVGQEVLAFAAPIRVHGSFRGAMILLAHKALLDGLLQSATVSSRHAVLMDRRGEVIAARDLDSTAAQDTLPLLKSIAGSGPQPQFGSVRWPGHGQLLYRWVNDDWLLSQPVSYWELYGPTLLKLTPLAIALLALGSLLLVATFRMAMLLIAHQLDAEANLREQALRDPLTGLANRRYLSERYDAVAADCQRNGKPLGFVMFDIDHFKRINDHWGHASGDAVLKTVANTALSIVRTSDTVVRLGGEEFGLLLPGATPEAVQRTAERLRCALADAPCAPVGKDGARLPEVDPIRFTASFGTAEAQDDGSFGIDALMAIADARLYQAKERGRNQVVGKAESARCSQSEAHSAAASPHTADDAAPWARGASA